MRGPKFTLGGAARPLAEKFSFAKLGGAALPHAPAEKMSYRKEYFALSKCVQSFKFLALIHYDI